MAPASSARERVVTFRKNERTPVATSPVKPSSAAIANVMPRVVSESTAAPKQCSQAHAALGAARISNNIPAVNLHSLLMPLVSRDCTYLLEFLEESDAVPNERGARGKRDKPKPQVARIGRLQILEDAPDPKQKGRKRRHDNEEDMEALQ
jgi:hypothetical protein